MSSALFKDLLLVPPVRLAESKNFQAARVDYPDDVLEQIYKQGLGRVFRVGEVLELAPKGATTPDKIALTIRVPRNRVRVVLEILEDWGVEHSLLKAP